MGIKFLGTVEIKENMTTEELDRKISEVIKDFQNGIEKKQQALSSSEDNVKSPKHYKLEGLNVESIEVIKSILGKEGFKAFCKGNTMKYLIRAEKKNGTEDYRKAKTYLDWYLEECDNND
jgi:hypothetical protein|nr:MAG TPA: nucelotide kinase [Caudoviricetes sp.]